MIRKFISRVFSGKKPKAGKHEPAVIPVSSHGITRRPVAITDERGHESIAIHSVGNLTMSWDHRAFDGGYAAAFLARMKEILQTRDWTAEL